MAADPPTDESPSSVVAVIEAGAKSKAGKNSLGGCGDDESQEGSHDSWVAYGVVCCVAVR